MLVHVLCTQIFVPILVCTAGILVAKSIGVNWHVCMPIAKIRVGYGVLVTFGLSC